MSLALASFFTASSRADRNNLIFSLDLFSVWQLQHLIFVYAQEKGVNCIRKNTSDGGNAQRVSMPVLYIYSSQLMVPP